jgi:hypothetical protein
MTRRLIGAMALAIAFGAATVHAAVTPIPPDQIPASCPRSDINGYAEQGDRADDIMALSPLGACHTYRSPAVAPRSLGSRLTLIRQWVAVWG